MNNQENGSKVNIDLTGKIDSNNAQEFEKNIFSKLAGCGNNIKVVLNAMNLDYISSAGLRVILRIKKAFNNMCIDNVNTDIYDTLEMTGFTEMMDVKKAYRVVNVEGCEVIGEGYNGKVYRIDDDNVVKTYKNADALAEIQHEREVAKLALVLGVPTAISYDVVRVGDSYGSVFELLNAKSFSKILIEEPEKIDFCVSENVKMLKKIHSIEVPEGKLPSIKENILKRAKRIKENLPDGLGDKLVKMIDDIPESNHMIHGDLHTKNIVLADGEVLLIDMDTLSVGHPIFEFSHMYNAYVGYSEYNPEKVRAFQGYSPEIARSFWHKVLVAYFLTDDEKTLNEIEGKIRIVSYTYLIDWSLRHLDSDDEESMKNKVSLWKERLISLLGTIDSLDFDPRLDEKTSARLDIEASGENLQEVIDYVNSYLEKASCSKKVEMQIDLAVEEIFVNISNYAYQKGKGNAVVEVSLDGETNTVSIIFSDRGIPYNPLQKTDPDITLTAEERQIGGLGIFMTKKIMDEVLYEYKEGQNILTLKKRLY